MILLADSGSTKTDWALVDGRNVIKHFSSQGINPYQMDDDAIINVLSSLNIEAPVDVEFYGSGCRKEQEERMIELFRQAMPTQKVHIYSDLLGACRALCGNEEGICCILGTGSASCLYDGAEVIQQTPSLGYILGDEGSGCSLGKHLLADVLKRQLPEDLCEAFAQEYKDTIGDVLDRIYKQPLANRYLASFVPFLVRHRSHPAVQCFLKKEFVEFIRRNVVAYRRQDLPVSFVGGVAYQFYEELQQSVCEQGMQIGKIIKAPLEMLIAYHSSK